MEYTYLLHICIILVATKMMGILTGKMQLPQVVGALLAGLILGPAFLSVVQPSEFLGHLAELGVIIMMFSAGLETNIDELKKSGKASFIIALLGVLVPLVMGAGLTYFFNPSGNVLENIFVGVVLTATSVSITVETLKEMGKLSTKVGNTILAAALIDDILGLVCLTVVSSMGGEGVNIGIVLLKILLFFVFTAIIGFVCYKLFRWYSNRVKGKNLRRFPIAAFALCLFMAWVAEAIFGVADIIGAFAAGVIIATTPKGVYIEHKVTPLSYMLLSPIFFANIGLSVVLPEMTSTIVIFSILLVLVGIFSKLIGCGIGAKLCKFTSKQSLQVGIGMACRGEVALIVANKGMAMGIIPEDFFGPIVIMVVVCTIATPILLKMAFKNDGKTEGLEESGLVDNFQLSEQMDIVADQLLTDELQNKKQK